MKNRCFALTATFTKNLIYPVNLFIYKGIMPNLIQPRSVILLKISIVDQFFLPLKPYVRPEKIHKKHLITIAFASFFGVAVNPVLIKPVMRHFRAVIDVRWILLFGSAYVIALTLSPVFIENWTSIPVNIWITMGCVIIFTTFLAFLLNNYSFCHICPSTNNDLIYPQLVFASYSHNLSKRSAYI